MKRWTNTTISTPFFSPLLSNIHNPALKGVQEQWKSSLPQIRAKACLTSEMNVSVNYLINATSEVRFSLNRQQSCFGPNPNYLKARVFLQHPAPPAPFPLKPFRPFSANPGEPEKVISNLNVFIHIREWKYNIFFKCFDGLLLL